MLFQQSFVQTAWLLYRVFCILSTNFAMKFCTFYTIVALHKLRLRRVGFAVFLHEGITLKYCAGAMIKTAQYCGAEHHSPVWLVYGRKRRANDVGPYVGNQRSGARTVREDGPYDGGNIRCGMQRKKAAAYSAVAAALNFAVIPTERSEWSVSPTAWLCSPLLDSATRRGFSPLRSLCSLRSE